MPGNNRYHKAIKRDKKKNEGGGVILQLGMAPSEKMTIFPKHRSAGLRSDPDKCQGEPSSKVNRRPKGIEEEENRLCLFRGQQDVNVRKQRKQVHHLQHGNFIS
jgi:hypothetical protein